MDTCIKSYPSLPVFQFSACITLSMLGDDKKIHRRGKHILLILSFKHTAG